MVRKIIEIKKWYSEDVEGEVNALFVDDEVFDWGLGPGSLQRAQEFCMDSADMRKSVVGDIKGHFLDSFAEFIGFETIDMKMLIQAIKDGYIDVEESVEAGFV